MSDTISNNFSRKKLQQLLAAIGSSSSEATTQEEFTEYDWHQPHHFNTKELERLDDLAKETAGGLSEKLTELCHSKFDVTVTSTTQQFADELLSPTPDNQDDDYRLTFGTDKDPLCGIVSIPAKTATFLVAQLLGESESHEDSNETLSELERSLLLDIACVIVEVLSGSYDNYDFQPAGGIFRGQPSFELQGTEELWSINLNIKKDGSEDISDAKILICCETLHPFVGRTAQDSVGFSAEETSKAVLENLQEMPVTIAAQLGSAMLTFEEVTSLRPCDILLLDKGIDEPIELTVEGRTVYRGRPAKSTGKYAVVITELCESNKTRV